MCLKPQRNGRAVKVHAVQNLPCKVGRKQNFPLTLQRTSGAFGGPTAVEQENFRLRPESRRSIILERLSVRGWYPYGIVDISSAGGGARATITMQRNDLVFREALEGYIRGDTSSCPKNSPFL